METALAPGHYGLYSAGILCSLGCLFSKENTELFLLMVMKVLRQGAFGGFLKYILMSLLALSVLGLVFMDVQGVMQGGSVTGSDVARVGSESVSIRDFDKYARLRLGQLNMTPEDAYNTNPAIIDELLGTEIRSRFIMLEAKSIGISVGQKKIQEELIKRIKPMQNEGETLQQTLDRLLRGQGVREADFVKNYNREIVGDILMETAQDGFGTISPDMARDLFLLQNHKRDLAMLSFTEADIKDIKAPDEDQLKRLYESYKNTQFKIPEMRVVEVAYIDDSKLKETIDVSDEHLRSQYEERIEEYRVGEQRVLEQAVAPDADKAKALLKLARDEGVPLKDAMTRVLGQNEGTHVPAVPFSEDMMLPDIRALVMTAKSGDVVGPVETVMGQHIISVGETIAPHTLPFEDVRDALRKELEQIALTDMVYDLSTQLDDQLAGGNSFADASGAVPLNIVTLPAMNAFGLDQDKKDIFEGMGDADKSDKAILLEEGYALQEGETSRVYELPSGRFAAMRVKLVTEASSKPYEDVKQTIADDFIKDQKRVEIFRKIAEFVKQIKAGEKTFEQVAQESGKSIEKLDGLTLGGAMPAPLNDNQRAMIFESHTGDVLTLPFEGGAALAVITATHLPQIDKKGEEQIARIANELAKETQDEVFNYYVQWIGQKYPAVVNHRLLDQVYSRRADGEAQR